MIQKKIFAGLVAGAMLAGASVSAATVSIVGGGGGNIPGGQTNEGLGPLGLPNPLAGFFGSTIKLDGPAKVTFTLLGYEAGFINQFSFGLESLNGGGGNMWAPAGIAGESFMAIAGAGTLAFSFLTDGGGTPDSVANGSNPDNSQPGINFFASTNGDQSGKFVYLFLDDGGAQNDDNHDDLVVRIDVAAVPLPAGGLLLLGALGGLAALRRRKNAA